MKYILERLSTKVQMWFLIKKLEVKYSWILDVYIKIFPMKFKDDQYVLYKSSVWRIYFCHKSYRPYYYYIYQSKYGKYFTTQIAEETDLLEIPPVLKVFYED